MIIRYNNTFQQLVFFILVIFTQSAYSDQLNGFDISKLNIDANDILGGGPAKDGIPSIDQPKFISPSDVDFLNDDDLVISYSLNGITKAYPIRILIWHEIVNDFIADQAITVTYCPLCGTGMVFDRNINNTIRSFGVSGLLYYSDVLMYDRETLSLWTQLGMKGVSKDAIGLNLKWLVSTHMTWKSWREAYPQGKVLSTDTGFNRLYSSAAYADYFKSDNTMFPVPKFRTELPQKDKILGVIIDGQAKAYPLKKLEKALTVKDIVNNQHIKIHYNNQAITVTDTQNNTIPSVVAYWFAWQSFYPNTLLGLKD